MQAYDSQAASKVTSILPFEDTLWVGTADGHIAIYNVVKLEAPEIQEDQTTNGDSQALPNGTPEEEVDADVADSRCNGIAVGINGDVDKNGEVDDSKLGEDKELPVSNTDSQSNHQSRTDKSPRNKSTSDDVPKKSRKNNARNYERVHESGFIPPPIPLHGYEMDQKVGNQIKLDAVNLPLPLSDVDNDSDSPRTPPPVLVTDIDEEPSELPMKESRSAPSSPLLDVTNEIPPDSTMKESKPSPSECRVDGTNEIPLELPVKESKSSPPGPVMDSKDRIPSITPLPALDLECQLPDPEEIVPLEDSVNQSNVSDLPNGKEKSSKKVKRKVNPSTIPDDALLDVDGNRDPLARSPSGISGDFVMVDKEQSGEDGDNELFRSQSPLSASASHDSHSDEESRSRASRTKKRKGSKKRLNSPHALRKLLASRPSKEKLELSTKEDEQPQTHLKPPGSSIGRMFGKLTRGNSSKTNKYRYSRELRDVTRRGSLGPSVASERSVVSTDSEMSLISLVESGNHAAAAGTNDVQPKPPRPVRRMSRPVFETSDIIVHPRYDLHVQAKRKVSEHQVRCLMRTRYV